MQNCPNIIKVQRKHVELSQRVKKGEKLEPHPPTAGGCDGRVHHDQLCSLHSKVHKVGGKRRKDQDVLKQNKL